MSMNIHQVYVANPITSNTSTDLMYFGQSPYGAGDDAAMTYANFSAQFAGNVLTTKGDLYTFSTVNARLAVGTVDGQILQVHSASTTGLAWSTPTYPSTSGSAGKILRSDATNNIYSTATYPDVATSTGSFMYADGTNWIASTSLWPNTVGTIGKILRSDGTVNSYTTSTFADTYAASTILYSNGANTVTGLTTANSSVLVTTSAGVPVQSGTMTNGQMIIGSTGATPVVGTITTSGNISVTTGAGTLALAGTGMASFTWNDVAGTSQAASAYSGYIISNAGQTTVTLPATCAEGVTFSIAGKGAAGWILQMNTGQTCHFGNAASSSAGSLTSTNLWDSVSIVCVTANTTFAVTSAVGNLTVA